MLVPQQARAFSIDPNIMRRSLTGAEIKKALEEGGLEVVLAYDYAPSSNPDEAAYQEIDFHQRAWRSLLLAATGRDKISRQLLERQRSLRRKRTSAKELRVNVLTAEAARNLEKAGFQLECSSESTSRLVEVHCG
jgi:hypothetical protein